MQYELFYLVGERQEANLDKIKGDINSLLVSVKASLLEPELFEKRKLAYEIKHQNKGIYITRRFELPEIENTDETNRADFGIEAITKKLNLYSDILRFMIVKTEDLPDLGAKERRKAQEMTNQKQALGRPQQRPAKQDNQTQEPAIKQISSEIEQPQITKEDTKNIDEQLDKLLDI
ncbi:MAG TPA: 30S ribosomal protein S6 [Candidatus Moranbacteria bacterium]|nr:30S ribosomal protein S6 [Candidatus Moranbacteria bacterium]HRZ33974.1 30S ribosomal protein S6 [Candidatus Moranbacteria bacterium]